MNLSDILKTSPTGTIGIRCKWVANENISLDIRDKRVNKVLALNPCQDNKSNDTKVVYQRCQTVPSTSVRLCYGEFRLTRP